MMGYYAYQNGLIYNHLNQDGGWDEHLGKCRSFILKAVDYYSPQKITVLGSGWLMDFPVAEIVERDIKICLVDIVHPPEVIAQAGALKNVEMAEEDITGGLIGKVWTKASGYSLFKKIKTLDDIIIPEYQPQSDPGLVISLNVLTQLESLPVEYLKRRSVFKDKDFLKFRTEIQKKHIEFLMKHKSVLISDTEETETDRSGNVNHIKTILAEVPEGKIREEWTWNFDLKRADFYNKTSVMRVLAVIL